MDFSCHILDRFKLKRELCSQGLRGRIESKAYCKMNFHCLKLGQLKNQKTMNTMTLCIMSVFSCWLHSNT